MSIFHAVRQFFNAPPPSIPRVDSPVSSVVELEQLGPLANKWEITTGRLYHPHQERRVTFHNSEIDGTCTGKIGELTGSVMVGLFDELPTWLPSLLIRVTIWAIEGELTVSLRESNGAIVSALAPGTLEGNAELVSGRVWLRCESGPMPARNICYEAVII